MDLVRNPDKAKAGLTWADILAEEPFEGQHWEGAYGLPPGAVRGAEHLDGDESDSSPSLSPWDDEDDLDNDSSSPWDTSSELEEQLPTPAQDTALDTSTERFSRQIALYSHRDEVEGLQATQYWRSDWRGNARLDRPFDIGDPSTLREYLILSILISELNNSRSCF